MHQLGSLQSLYTCGNRPCDPQFQFSSSSFSLNLSSSMYNSDARCHPFINFYFKKSTYTTKFHIGSTINGDAGITESSHISCTISLALPPSSPLPLPSFLPSSTLRGTTNSSSFSHRLFFRLVPLMLNLERGSHLSS